MRRSRILVTDRADAEADLVYAPQTIVLGIGCERLADEDEVWRAGAQSRCAKANIAEEAIACVASIALKAAEPAIHGVARRLGVPARFFEAARLERETPRLENPSDLVFRETGCHGVAEGAALAGVGADGDLIVPKQRSQRATCAIARSPEHRRSASSSAAPAARSPSSASAPARRRRARTRSRPPSAAATDLVGYKLYLDLLGPLAEHKARHGYELGEEEMRVRIALGLAAQGRDVALVCSGDAGIYAMATLVFELIEREGNADWARVEITGLPGVSAMQTAAARIGAPLGHDFCAISLTDLLTPWEAIEQRLRAAAGRRFRGRLLQSGVAAPPHAAGGREGDPAAASPAGNAGGAGAQSRPRGRDASQSSRSSDLKIEDVDMLTLVIVGSSATRAVPRPDGGVWVYTPRGYAKKMDQGKARGMSIVHFIGAGPGDPELITVRGKRLIEDAPVVLYAGSLVPPAVVAMARAGCAGDRHRAADAGRDRRAYEGRDRGRQGRWRASIPAIPRSMARSRSRCAGWMSSASHYDVTPGVPAFAAAAAMLKTELTLPEVSQTIILTRTDGAASPMPKGEDLATLGAVRRDPGHPSLGAQHPQGGARS